MRTMRKHIYIALLALSLAGCAARRPAPWRFIYAKNKPYPDCVPFQERDPDTMPEWVCPNPDYQKK